MKYVLIGMMVLLAGCTTTKLETVVVTKHIEIPERYLDCDVLKKRDYPKSINLKDKEVAKLILKMDKRIAECAADAKAMKSLQKKTVSPSEVSFLMEEDFRE